MSAYVLILVSMMVSYDGGTSMTSVPFATKEACEAAAARWSSVQPHPIPGRTKVFAICHPTGAKP
jgi:hypothetical protein